jgi:hypothetical protein
MAEFVVPRSMPIVFGTFESPLTGRFLRKSESETSRSQATIKRTREAGGSDVGGHTWLRSAW